MLQEKDRSASKKWKLINYRTVKDLITAEFLHDLYNRHRPEINSIRFRNTLCILRGCDFRSYAPQDEWDYLGTLLGRRFYQREKHLLQEVVAYTKREKKNLIPFLSSFPKDLSSKSLEELYEMLVKLHNLALGEVYGINLVQIEHGLNWAISQHLPNNAKDFSVLPNFEWESQLKIFEKALLEASLAISENNESFEEAFCELFQRAGHFMNAYGSGVDGKEKIRSQLERLLSIDLNERKRILITVGSVKRTPSAYADLYEISSKIAELRDKNKLMMGFVASKRDALLQEIAAKCNLSRQQISRYSLLEINDLIYKDAHLSSKTLTERQHLVILKREESFYTNIRAEAQLREFYEQPCTHSEVKESPIYGTIASKGVVRGRARIVFSHKECEKIQKTDILVALGTDFDLLHGITCAAGVITEEGGILSHASVVSRELAKPCLIGVPHLLTLVQEGDMLLLNCDEGYVKIENSSEAQLYSGMELLHEKLEGSFPSKILNLNQLAKEGFPVLRGICMHDSFEELPSEVQRVFAHHLQSDTLIIRGCSAIEDQKERSYAGASCSRVVTNEPSSLKAAFYEIRERGAELGDKNAFLIQPFLHFDFGGVAFTDSASEQVILEMSSKGPFEVVNGEIDRRERFNWEELRDEKKADSIAQEAARMACKISEFFGYDVDVEWGIEKGKLWVLQARPVTVPCSS